MRRINNIIIHCSDSLWGCAREIKAWHLAKGWSDIGYHFIVLNGLPTFGNQKNMVRIPALDGAIECGRFLDDDSFISDLEIGIHALGYNATSIGVCLIGTGNFTQKQISSLHRLLLDLSAIYRIPSEKILGHCETDGGKKQGKSCPNLSMQKLRDDLATWQKVETQQLAQRRV